MFNMNWSWKNEYQNISHDLKASANALLIENKFVWDNGLCCSESGQRTGVCCFYFVRGNEYLYFSFTVLRSTNLPKNGDNWPHTMQEQNANTNSSVHFHGSLHPLCELVDIGVNAILMWQGTSLAPAHDACKHPPAVPIQHWTGQRSPAIVSACVSATFFKSSTQEIISYRPVVRARKKERNKQ